MKMTIEAREAVCRMAKENDADLVGFVPVEHCGKQAEKILQILPSAKSVIVLIYRVLRGSYRGIEEGTTYYQYTTTGVETMEENIMPLSMLRVCSVLEDNGFEAVPQRRNQTVTEQSDAVRPEMLQDEIYFGKKTELELDFKALAVDAGLGEIGKSGALLTDEFGPMVRICAILTDAEVDAPAKREPHLCDGCGKCAEACPGKAIALTRLPDENPAPWQCAAYYVGANRSKNPFMAPDALLDDPERMAILCGEAQLSPERAKEIIRQMFYYPNVKHGYASSICGRACDRACYVHLEESGKLTKKYKKPFRRRPEWVLSNDDLITK